MNGKYAPASEAELTRLVVEHPLAWVVSGDAGALGATLLPLRPRIDADGRVAALIGHFARSNPQVAQLRAQPRALVLFLGVHGYVSPSWMQDRTQAPTWNYASAQFAVEVELFGDDETAGAAVESVTAPAARPRSTAATPGAAGTGAPPRTDAMLDDMVDVMESGRANAWHASEMGARYGRLVRAVVGFEARIVDRRAKFKLGQDERDDVYVDILAGLRAQGDDDLVAWMQRANPGRGE